MRRLAIRCHSCTPAPATELTVWLEHRIEELRSRTPLLVRVSYLTSELPTTAVDDGWLLELEMPAGLAGEELEPALRALQEMVRDMRVLGFTPTVLAPAELGSDGLSALGLRTAQLPATTVAGS